VSSTHRRVDGSGSLTIVGIGIRLGVQLTPEARLAIESADVAFYLASDPVGLAWLQTLNPNGRSLHTLYREGEERHSIYERMTEQIIEPVRRGQHVCAAFYGHPGVLVTPSHEAIRRVRAAGLPARMLPAISAEDCLFADLGVDPVAGCQSYEATDFLLRARLFDPTAPLILWQVAVIGALRYSTRPRTDGLRVLTDRLRQFYDRDHQVTLYEASPYPIAGPLVTEVALADLSTVDLKPMATLYVPPKEPRPVDRAMLERLGLA
jgi:hypothetical protein